MLWGAGLGWEPALELTAPSTCLDSLGSPTLMEERRWELEELGLWSFSILILGSHRTQPRGPCGCGRAASPPAAETPPAQGRAISHGFSSTPSPSPPLPLAPLGPAPTCTAGSWGPAPPAGVSIRGDMHGGLGEGDGRSAAILSWAARCGQAGCSRDAQGVLEGCLRDARGMLKGRMGSPLGKPVILQV